jgi:tRNA1(Val) A37 N6-methylase TrmN6
MMALIFQRVARNFIKNGYFPTDEVTLERIINALDIAGSESRIFDPCCGEGTALAEISRHLTNCGGKVQSYAVEYDRERAWHAKSILDNVAHADINDVFGTLQSMGLLFLNPPYGDLISDKAGIGDKSKRDRLEKVFMRKTMTFLQIGGVLVLIVPQYVLDGEFASLIGRNFTNVKTFMAPEKRFKQAVVFGIRCRSSTPSLATIKAIGEAFDGTAQELAESWCDEPYYVPAISTDTPISFQSVKIDSSQLAFEINKFRHATMWPQFSLNFRSTNLPTRRPLRDLSKWHLALALAAGHINGVVESRDGRKLLVKGDTLKGKNLEIERTVDEDGKVTETRILTDKFIPVIRGIDFTPGASLGNVVEIR